MTAAQTTAFRPLYLADTPTPIGHMSYAAAALLEREGLLTESASRLTLARPDMVTEQLEDARDLLARRKLIGPFRDEAMPVRMTFDGPAVAFIDRSALRIFGFWVTKIHINGLVCGEDEGRTRIWLSRRSRAAEAAPGAYDTLVAGGQAHGVSLMETVAREAWEEAGLTPPDLASAAHLRNLPIQYVTEQGFHQEMLAIYDLSLGAGFTPICQDGEIEQSVLLTLPEITALLADPQAFKFGSRVVCEDLVARLSRDALAPEHSRQLTSYL